MGVYQKLLCLVLLTNIAFSYATTDEDCPLVAEHYSIDMPLSDVLADANARHLLLQHAPNLISSFTDNFGGGELPDGFANILTPRFLLNMRPGAKKCSRVSCFGAAVAENTDFRN